MYRIGFGELGRSSSSSADGGVAGVESVEGDVPLDVLEIVLERLAHLLELCIVFRSEDDNAAVENRPTAATLESLRQSEPRRSLSLGTHPGHFGASLGIAVFGCRLELDDPLHMNGRDGMACGGSASRGSRRSGSAGESGNTETHTVGLV